MVLSSYKRRAHSIKKRDFEHFSHIGHTEGLSPVYGQFNSLNGLYLVLLSVRLLVIRKQ